MWIYKKKSNQLQDMMGLKKSLPFFLHFSRLILGLVFVFSGFVKLIDPLGFVYKIEDYFTAFGGIFLHLDFLSLFAAIALPAFEFLIGLNLIFMIQLRRTSVFALLFMAVMTPLTLYIAVFNPVSDCGCFGDALVISNWQTFYKNLVLISLALFLFFNTRKHKPLLMPKIEWLIVILFACTGVGLSLYSYNHLPLIDFMPYKTGVNIPEAMMVPEGAPKDVYSTTFIYKKNGVEKEFTLENYPKNDSSWVFVDQKTKLVSVGYKAPIHDFSIVDANFNDITEEVIFYPEATYLLIMYDLNKTSVEGAQRAETLYQKYKNSTTKFYALTASGDEDLRNFCIKNKLSYPFCKTDPITLKTIIRANPGLVLIKNGVIKGKWHWKDI